MGTCGSSAALALVGVCALLLSACTSKSVIPEQESGSPGEQDQSADSDGFPSEAALRSAIEQALSETGVPGIAVELSNGQGQRVAVQHGVAVKEEATAEGEPVVAETTFAYRSITKSFVGTVILQLVDEGSLSLDDPVSQHIDGVPNGDAITIEHLGTMRSGLANYSALPEFGEILSADPETEPTIAQLLEPAYAASPVFEPGTEYEYSNTNTLLLGEIIEAVEGRSWFDSVEARLLDPLGLNSAAYGFDTPATDAHGYQLANGEVIEALPPVAPGWFGAAGALTGNVANLAIWGRVLGSGAFLESATHADRISLLGETSDDQASPRYDHYGFAIGELDGWVGHTGNGLGFQSLVMYEPTNELVIAIVMNGTGEDPDLPVEIFNQVRELL